LIANQETLFIKSKTCRPSIPALTDGAFRGRHRGCFSGRGVRHTTASTPIFSKRSTVKKKLVAAHTLLWPFIHGLTPVAFWLTPVKGPALEAGHELALWSCRTADFGKQGWKLFSPDMAERHAEAYSHRTNLTGACGYATPLGFL